MSPLGYVAIDYRGFGNSEGSLSEAGFYADAREIMRYTLDRLKIPLTSIVIMGESIGNRGRRSDGDGVSGVFSLSAVALHVAS